MPALNLPSDFSVNAISTTTDIPGAVAEFPTVSKRAVVFVGVRMDDARSYSDLNTTIVFYPPPTIFPAHGTITVVRGETVTLIIAASIN